MFLQRGDLVKGISRHLKGKTAFGTVRNNGTDQQNKAYRTKQLRKASKQQTGLIDSTFSATVKSMMYKTTVGPTVLGSSLGAHYLFQ